MIDPQGQLLPGIAKVYVLVGYVAYEGGTLLGAYSTREKAEGQTVETSVFDDLAVHKVEIDAAPVCRSSLDEDGEA